MRHVSEGALGIGARTKPLRRRGHVKLQSSGGLSMSLRRATAPNEGIGRASAKPSARSKVFSAPPLVVGRSPSMRQVLALIHQVASTNSTVLIHGETGAGKEVVARNIHLLSHLRDEVFLPINCGAIPENLLESQLFGHAKGAFTGADSSNQGLFYRARGGTIFLDEIGEMPPGLQVKLLRLIEEKEILPLGTVIPIEVDVRIIAATNQDLRAAVKAGRFREDLFYRINVVSIPIPPLRERPEDIPLLADHIVQRHNAGLGRSYRGLDEAVLRLVMALPLRGNVRELDHLIEYAMIVGDGEWIRLENLPPGVAPDASVADAGGDDLASALKRFAKAHISTVLSRHNRDRRKAAASLGIDLSTLYRKIQELRIADES